MKAKKIVSAFGIAGAASFAVCLAFFNLTNVSGTTSRSNVALSNVTAAQASATEATCDASNINICSIVTPNGTIVGTGKGVVKD
jgi:hypothetical protein